MREGESERKNLFLGGDLGEGYGGPLDDCSDGVGDELPGADGLNCFIIGVKTTRVENRLTVQEGRAEGTVGRVSLPLLALLACLLLALLRRDWLDALFLGC